MAHHKIVSKLLDVWITNGEVIYQKLLRKPNLCQKSILISHQIVWQSKSSASPLENSRNFS